MTGFFLLSSVARKISLCKGEYVSKLSYLSIRQHGPLFSTLQSTELTQRNTYKKLDGTRVVQWDNPSVVIINKKLINDL
jgi:hypothetical protein